MIAEDTETLHDLLRELYNEYPLAWVALCHHEHWVRTDRVYYPNPQWAEANIEAQVRHIDDRYRIVFALTLLGLSLGVGITLLVLRSYEWGFAPSYAILWCYSTIVLLGGRGAAYTGATYRETLRHSIRALRDRAREDHKARQRAYLGLD